MVFPSADLKQEVAFDLRSHCEKQDFRCVYGCMCVCVPLRSPPRLLLDMRKPPITKLARGPATFAWCWGSLGGVQDTDFDPEAQTP